MFHMPIRWALPCIFLLSSVLRAQTLSLTTNFDSNGMQTSLSVIQQSQMDLNLFLIGSRNPHTTELQKPDGSVSRLDLKSPSKAQKEYQKGYQLLSRQDPQGAIEHLTKAIAIYPKFVAAHNALGSAYLSLGKNELARGEFTEAIALDDHLPNSFLNLGCADLALKQYPAAEEAMRKASSLAPLDIQLQLALTYGEFINHDYKAVIATAQQVHEHKHEGAAVVHYFAAGAWEAQGNPAQAQHEIEILLQEDPSSKSAGQFRQILDQIKDEQVKEAAVKLQRAQRVALTVSVPRKPTPEQEAQQAQLNSQKTKEQLEIDEVEKAQDPACLNCSATDAQGPSGPLNSEASLNQPNTDPPGASLRITVDEVGVFFAATDHGKSMTDLTAADVQVLDNSKAPRSILAFRNESQLPLRLGLVIDTSASVTDRFSFEQAAAAKFLDKAVVGKDDLVFVVGVNNTVLLAQDFTSDRTLTSRALSQLAPAGGTALWDAIDFAAGKLASRAEVQPVARLLVVISDGDDNSSNVTLKDAIATAQRGDVAVYTVSSLGGLDQAQSDLLGNHALKTLSEFTGGTAFLDSSIHSLNKSLDNLQQIIRGRYLVSYSPASFEPNGQYRTVDIAAQKDGHKVKVFARKGYYAPSAP